MQRRSRLLHELGMKNNGKVCNFLIKIRISFGIIIVVFLSEEPINQIKQLYNQENIQENECIGWKNM